MSKEWARLLAIILLCSGCASTKQFVPRPETVEPPNDKVFVQVKRPVEWYGGWLNAIVISDNGEVVGHLGPGDDLLWGRDPGRMELTAHLSVFNVRAFRPVEVQTSAGNKYDFRAFFPFWYPLSNRGLKPAKSPTTR